MLDSNFQSATQLYGTVTLSYGNDFACLVSTL